MPELPDLTVYIEAMRERILGSILTQVRMHSLFVLRSVEPRIEELEGRPVVGIERIGKRLVLALEGEFFVVIHLMVAGRLHWRDPEKAKPHRHRLANFVFASAESETLGVLCLDEAGKKKRASIHCVAGRAALVEHDRGGLDVLTSDFDTFVTRMQRDVHTLKRALTDPSILSGIGNAYSDEILWEARLSPFRRTDKLDAAEWNRLFDACKTVLTSWSARLVAECNGSWPTKVTAFRPEMAVHGKHRELCPRCGEEVQRIVYADNEANYCVRCQTGGKLLADRALSQLLRGDWPRSLEELDAMRERHRGLTDS
ncbi:MAG: formamidopyrimidine-DNA glycosylase [Planctomycetes bacterium]|nr:formamidopyrimidine-DNA glycosylase [Planctomycetota bacterium]